MKENISEIPKVFRDVIPLDEKMSPEEAVDKLASFHGTNAEAILDAFINLRNFNEGTVEFRDSVNSGYPCVVMEGCDNNGAFKWNHLIDKHSGQPQMRCS